MIVAKFFKKAKIVIIRNIELAHGNFFQSRLDGFLTNYGDVLFYDPVLMIFKRSSIFL